MSFRLSLLLTMSSYASSKLVKNVLSLAFTSCVKSFLAVMIFYFDSTERVFFVLLATEVVEESRKKWLDNIIDCFEWQHQLSDSRCCQSDVAAWNFQSNQTKTWNSRRRIYIDCPRSRKRHFYGSWKRMGWTCFWWFGSWRPVRISRTQRSHWCQEGRNFSRTLGHYQEINDYDTSTRQT